MAKQFNIYFTDRKMNILGITSPNLKLLWDKETSILSEGASVLEGIMAYNGKRFDKEASDFVKVGNYILFENEYGESRIFTIIDSEKDRKNNEINFYAENGSLDLLNEVVRPFEAIKDMTITEYFTMYLKNSGYKIGINELGKEYSRKLKWEGSATVTERLLSVATQFDHAEIDFSFTVKGMKVTEKFVNIYKKRGVETGVTLQLDKDVNNIITTESIKNLATSLYVTGSVPEGGELPITLKGYKPSNPDPRFVIEDAYLRDIESNQIWSRFLADGGGVNGGYITKGFSYETLSQSELYNRAVNKLKDISKVEQNFEVDIAVLPDNVRLGDTVRIVDQNDRLYLEARVLQLEMSRSVNDSKAILGDFLIKEDGFNDKFKELADKIANIPKGETFYTWIMYAEDDKGKGINASPVGKYFIGFAYNKAVAKPSTVPTDYTWSAMYDEEQMAKLQEQINNLNYVGTNLWAPEYYKDNLGAVNATGAIQVNKNYMYTDYIPVESFKNITRTTFEIAENTWFVVGFYDKDKQFISRTVAPANAVGSLVMQFPVSTSFIIINIANPHVHGGKHKVELGNKATDYSISPLDTPTTGDLSNVQTELQKQLNTIVTPVIQPTAPTNPKEGMFWWQDDLKGDILGCFKYIANHWVPQTLQQSMLNIIELNAIRITGSTITGTEISGSTIISAFDVTVVQGSPERRRGTLTLDKGYALIQYEQYHEDTPNVVINKGETRMDEYGISTVLKDKNDNVLVSSQYGPLGININDRSKPYGQVNLGYNDLLTIPESPFTSDMYATGFTQYTASADNQPRYSRNSRMVQLSGAVKNTSVVRTGSALIHIATLPVGVRPMRRVNIRCQSDGMNSFMLAVMADGNMYISRFGITSYTSIPPESWLNIAVSYVAAD